jgi:hypothetical protein
MELELVSAKKIIKLEKWPKQISLKNANTSGYKPTPLHICKTCPFPFYLTFE